MMLPWSTQSLLWKLQHTEASMVAIELWVKIKYIANSLSAMCVFMSDFPNRLKKVVSYRKISFNFPNDLLFVCLFVYNFIYMDRNHCLIHIRWRQQIECVVFYSRQKVVTNTLIMERFGSCYRILFLSSQKWEEC